MLRAALLCCVLFLIVYPTLHLAIVGVLFFKWSLWQGADSGDLLIDVASLMAIGYSSVASPLDL